MLTHTEYIRYHSQLTLPDIGLSGQLRLKNARVLCIGAGGLGSSLLYYLAAAGVGTLGIIDPDSIHLSNLQRQILYQYPHCGLKKVLVAKTQLIALNPELNIITYDQKFDAHNADAILTEYDIVADCSDNFSTRYVTNDACFRAKKPFVFAGIEKYQGQCATFLGEKGPCFRCLFPAMPEKPCTQDCKTQGVLGVLPGLVGTLQASEILKWILSWGDLLTQRLWTINLESMQHEQYNFSKNPECTLC